MGAVHNDLTHSMLSVYEDFCKYLKEHGSQNELLSDPDAMQIDSVGAVPNYLPDTMASIPSGTLRRERTPVTQSAFSRFPKQREAPQEVSQIRHVCG